MLEQKALEVQEDIILSRGNGLSVLQQIKDESDRKEAVEAAETLLRLVCGLDVNDAHGKDTPVRFVEMLRELTTPKPIKFTTFPSEGFDEMIVTDRIPFRSLCEHHVVPFIGHAAIGYVPGDKIVGLSKFARVVHHFACGIQVQERLTKQIAEFLNDQLQPRGVAVFLEAEHLCMTIRGAQVPGAMTRTAVMKGVFADHEKTAKMEFFEHLRGGRR
jgi:GTP cyclohydrolase I